jgi:hypothetical protein
MRIILEYPCHESITIITVITFIRSICRVVKMQSLNLTYQFILSISVVTHWSQQENERRYSYNLIDQKIITIFMFLIMLLILWKFFLYHFKIFEPFCYLRHSSRKTARKHNNYLFGLHHNRNIEYLCTKQYTAMCFRTYNWNPRTK